MPLLPTFLPGAPTVAGNMADRLVRVDVWLGLDGSTPSSGGPLWTQVTDYVFHAPGITTAQGRSSMLSTFSAATAEFVLNNNDRRFEPGFTTGPYGSAIQPGVPVMIRARVGATAGGIFYGWVLSWDPYYDHQFVGYCKVTCTDAFTYLANRAIGSSAFAVDLLNDSPQAWYRLDEGSGTTAYDSSGAQRNGTYSGTPAWTSSLVAGDSDQALSCAAGDVKVALPVAAKVSVPYTVEAWVQVAAIESQRVIWIQEDKASLTLCVGNGGSGAYLVFNDALATGTEVCGGVPITTGNHHVVVTRSGGSMRFYIDGTEVTGAMDRGVRLPTGATDVNLAKPQANPTAPAFSNKTNGNGTTVTAPTSNPGDLLIVASFNGTGLTGGFRALGGLGGTTVWGKIASTSEPASWTLSGSNISWAACCYTGCVQVMDAALAWTVTQFCFGTGAQSAPGIALPTINCLWVVIAGDANTGGVTPPVGAGLTDRASAATTGSAIDISDKTHPGGTTSTLSGSFVNSGCYMAVPLTTRPLGNPYTSTLDEVAVYASELTPARIAAHYAATVTRWVGDTTGARVNRVLDAIGWPTNRRDVDTGDVTMGPANLSAGMSALAALQVCETAEQGRLFQDVEGRIAFRARSSATTRPNESSVQTTWTG